MMKMNRKNAIATAASLTLVVGAVTTPLGLNVARSTSIESQLASAQSAVETVEVSTPATPDDPATTVPAPTTAVAAAPQAASAPAAQSLNSGAVVQVADSSPDTTLPPTTVTVPAPTTAPTTAPPTTAPATTAPPATSAPTTAAPATTYETVSVGAAGDVAVAIHNGTSLEFWGAYPANGYQYRVEVDSASMVRVAFRGPGGSTTATLTLSNGQVVSQISLGAGGDDDDRGENEGDESYEHENGGDDDSKSGYEQGDDDGGEQHKSDDGRDEEDDD